MTGLWYKTVFFIDVNVWKLLVVLSDLYNFGIMALKALRTFGILSSVCLAHLNTNLDQYLGTSNVGFGDFGIHHTILVLSFTFYYMRQILVPHSRVSSYPSW